MLRKFSARALALGTRGGPYVFKRGPPWLIYKRLDYTRTLITCNAASTPYNVHNKFITVAQFKKICSANKCTVRLSIPIFLKLIWFCIFFATFSKNILSIFKIQVLLLSFLKCFKFLKHFVAFVKFTQIFNFLSELVKFNFFKSLKKF